MAGRNLFPASAPQETGFLDKLSANKKTREKQMQGIADQYVAGDIGEAEALGRMGVKYAQQLPDAAFSVMQEGFEALPESWQSSIKEGTKDVVGSVAALPVPFSESTVGDVASSAVQKYQDFEKQHPVAAGRVSSVLDVGNLALPFVKMGGKNAITATEEAIKQGVKTPVKIAGKAAQAALPAIDEGLAETAQIAQRFKIPLSVDQISSSNAVKNLQKVSQQLPFSGQSGFRAKQASRWQNEIFKTIGMDESKFTPKTMNKAFKQVGGEFDNLTKGKKFAIGDSFVNDLSDLATDMPSTYGEEAARTFQREAIKVIENFKGDEITGDIISRQRARINALARKAQGANKMALQDLETAIVDGITSGDPALKQALSQAKQRYKNLIVIEPLAAKAKGGFINPTQLNNRVSQVYRRAHTIGESGDIGDLARIGNELMPVLGGSDTVDKLSTIGTFGAAGGIGLLEPVTTGATLAGNRIMQSGLNRNQWLVNKLIEQGASAVEPNMIGSSVKNLITDQTGSMGGGVIAPVIAGGAAAANAPEQPTRITINPAAEGTEGMPDVNLPKGRNLFSPQSSVTLPEYIPDTSQSSFTQQNEGLRLSTYMDTTGNPTIGYGNNLKSPVTKQAWKAAGIQTPYVDAYKGRAAITPDEALRLHHASAEITRKDAEAIYGRLSRFTPNQQIALQDMSYQLGLPKLKSFTQFNAAIRKGDTFTAVNHLMKSKLATQTPERVKRVAQLLLS